ncbi:MAG: hypothetical protein RI907_472 [Pseudomonadota bacterium]
MTAPQTAPRHEAALLGLEVLRFVCAVSVLLWHYQHFFVFGAAHVAGFTPAQQPLYGPLKPFYEAGWLGVQTFWCLSGFIFFWKYAQPVAQGQVSAARFAWLRFSRLYPLHLVTLLAVLPGLFWYRHTNGVDFVYSHNDWPHFLLQLGLASDWPGRNEWSFNGPIWSISVEVLVYGLFFALCRLGLTRLWQVLAVIGVAGAVYASKRTEHPIVLCVFFFYLGALTQLGHAWLATQSAALRRTLLVLATVALAAGTALLWAGRLKPMFYAALLSPVAIWLLLATVQPASKRVQATLETLGHTTYASYLLHFPVQLTLMAAATAGGFSWPVQEAWFLLAFLGGVFTLAALSYRRLEVPAQAWLRRFSPR